MSAITDAEVGLARQVDLFRGLDDAQLRAVLDHAGPRQVPRDAFYFHEHGDADSLYVLVQGRVKLVQSSPDGHQVVLRIIVPGRMFGGIAALGGTRYPASAQAVTDSRSLGWDGRTMARLMERYPAIALRGLRHLAARLQEAQDRVRELATERVEQRVARALLRLVRQSGKRVEQGVLIDIPLSRQDLAEMTGTTLYTVSRILSAWEQKGVVATGRERVVVTSPHQLVSLAEDLPAATEPGSSPDHPAPP